MSQINSVEQRLKAAGLVLPPAGPPAGAYVPFNISGSLLFLSGQTCFQADGLLKIKGHLGSDVSIEQGIEGARLCALNLIAQAKAALGTLDRVVRVIRLAGYVNATPDFADGPRVLNGASEVFVTAFGDAGRHARSTIGVSSLPGNAAVEADAILEIRKA